MDYSVRDKSLDELLADLESRELQVALATDAYDIAGAAIAIKVAKTTQLWARVSAISAVTSVVLAIAAVVVAATS
jgi:hypothetical protein